jgi:arsenate reductase
MADIVITICGHADKHCPVLPSQVKKLHWTIDDPAMAVGTDAEVMDVFRTTHDEIRERVSRLITELGIE